MKLKDVPGSAHTGALTRFVPPVRCRQLSTQGFEGAVFPALYVAVVMQMRVKSCALTPLTHQVGVCTVSSCKSLTKKISLPSVTQDRQTSVAAVMFAVRFG